VNIYKLNFNLNEDKHALCNNK